MKLRPGNKKNQQINQNNRIKSAPQSAVTAELDRLREDLNASEEKYRATFEAASIAIISVDKEGVLLDYNRAAAELFGVGRTEMLGKSGVGIISKESLPEYAAGMKKVVEKGFSYNGRYRMKKKSGGVIDVIISSTAIKDKSGRFLRTISVIEDVTERIFMEEAMKESEEKYRMIFNSSDDAIMVHAPEKDGTPGRFIAVNKVACDRLGYTREELLKLTPADIHASKGGGVVKKSILHVLRNKHVKLETSHRAKNGALIPVEITANLFDLRGKPTVVVSAREISERKKSEAQLMEQNKYKELRAQIWKLAADKNIDEASLIRGLIDKLGASLGLTRAVYSRLDDEKLFTFYEWKKDGTKGTSMGLSIPAGIARRINFDRQMIADIDAAAGLVPPAFRGMIRMLLKSVSKRSGDIESLITPCSFDGKLEGLIFCVSAGVPIREWADEKRQLVSETARIIASAIADRRKDLLLKQKNEYGELRAGIWRLAADKNIKESDLIRGLISKIGTVLDAERVAYSSIKGENLSAEFEWKGEAAKGSSIGVKLPLEIFNRFKIDRQKVLNKENIFGLLPGGQHGLFRRVIELLMKSTDSEMKEVLSTMIYLDGRKFSAITCVYGVQGMWTADKKQLVLEAALIIERMFEQRKKDKELRESELKYRTLFESSNDAVIAHQPLPGHKPGPIIAVNKIACDRFGYTEKEFLKLNLVDINAPEARNIPVKATKNIFDTGKLTLETVHITKDGRRIPTEVTAVMINFKGKPTVIASSRDISERKRVEEKEKKHAMINSARAEIWKLASEKDISEKKLAEELIRILGPAVSAERVALGFLREKDFRVDYEWLKRRGIRPFKGFKIPRFIYEKFNLQEQKVFTPKKAVDYAPAAIKPVLLPVIKALSGKYSKKNSLVTPFGQGILICSYDGGNRDWLEEEKMLARETAQILSRVLSEKMAEKQVEESEELFRTAFNTSPDAININRMSDGMFLNVNEGFTKITGLAVEDVKGKTSLQVNIWEKPEDRQRLLQGLKKNGFVENMEGMFKTKTGELRNGLMSAKIISIKGAPHIMSITRDITDRIRAGEDIRESEEKYRELFNNANDGIFINELDEKGRVGGFVEVNDVGCKITGYTGEELSKMTPRGLSTPEFLLSYPAVGRSLAEKGRATYEQEVITKKGRRIIVENNSHKFMLKNRPIVLTVMRDITSRKKVEEALRESEEKYRSVISQTGQLVYNYSINSGIIEWSGAIEELTGYTAAEFNREVSVDVWAEMMHPNDRERVLSQLYAAQESCGKQHSEYRLRKKDGDYFEVLDEGICIPDEDNRAFRMLGVLKDITAMKHAENAIRESEEKFRAAFETSPDAISINDLVEGRYLEVNKGFETISGYAKDEIIGHTGEELGLWQDTQRRRDLIAEIKKNGRTENAEIMIIKKNGEGIYMLISSVIIKLKGTQCLLSISRDITDRKNAEEELRESEEKFRTFSEQSELGILMISGNDILYCNKAFLRIHGLLDDDMRDFHRRELMAMVHADDSAGLSAAMRRDEAAGIPLKRYGFRIYTKDKKLRYLDIYSRRLSYHGKAVDFMTIVDVSDVKVAETALKESEEKFRTLSEQSLLGITILQDGKFKYFNRAFLKMTGFLEGEMKDLSESEYGKYIHPDDANILIHRAVENGEIGKSNSYQFRIISRKGKTLWLDVYSRNILYEGRQANFITQVDITPMKNAQAYLERAVKDLERSNSELERFAYVASHDLQEPLRMISSYVQLLERRYKDKLDADANDFINYAVDGAARMQKLIKDLLAYSRLGTVEKQLVKLDTGVILEKVKENLAGAISEKNAIITGVNLPKITADESQVLQLFQNLISNSVKFASKDRQCVIEASAVKKGGDWQFCFRDNGIGIDKQYFEKIFVVFQRLHAATEYPGTGIGLAICKRIVENHGGRIWVESEENRGAAFYFTLPDREI